MDVEKVAELRERLYAIVQETLPELGAHGAAAMLRFIASDVEMQARKAGLWNDKNYAELLAMNDDVLEEWRAAAQRR